MSKHLYSEQTGEEYPAPRIAFSRFENQVRSTQRLLMYGHIIVGDTCERCGATKKQAYERTIKCTEVSH